MNDSRFSADQKTYSSTATLEQFAYTVEDKNKCRCCQEVIGGADKFCKGCLDEFEKYIEDLRAIVLVRK